MAARAAIQVSMSVEYQPIVRAVSFTDGGKLPACTRRKIVDRDRPVARETSGRRRMRIGTPETFRVLRRSSSQQKKACPLINLK